MTPVLACAPASLLLCKSTAPATWKSTFPVTQPGMFLKPKKDQAGSCTDSASVTCYCTNKIHGQRLCGLSSLHHSFPSALAALTPWLAVEGTRQMPALSPNVYLRPVPLPLCPPISEKCQLTGPMNSMNVQKHPPLFCILLSAYSSLLLVMFIY